MIFPGFNRLQGITASLLFLTLVAGGFTGCSQHDRYSLPEDLEYSNVFAVYTKDGRIIENVPAYKGDVKRWESSPALPEGLVIDPVTGVISGTPVAEQDITSYLIKASNPDGYAETAIYITVNNDPPSDLQYPETDLTYVVNAAVENSIPAVNGSGLLFTITPSLPEGLVLDPETGIISGTPAAVSGANDYIVIAENSGGSTQVFIRITVLSDIPDTAPSGLTYSNNNVTYYKDIQISGNVPSVTGVGITYSVTPALPAGLSLDTASGIISGTPGAVQGSTGYKVTATNAIGSTSRWVYITVEYDTLLSGLTVPGGTMVPAFDPDITGYMVQLDGGTNSVVVTPAASDVSDAAITVKGVSVVSGQASGSIPLTGTDNVVPVEVTAEDGATTRTYYLTFFPDDIPRQAYLKASNADEFDSFGTSVDIDGDTLVVGSKNESGSQRGITNGTGSDSDNSAAGSGAVYVYRWSGSIWEQEAYIKASNADADDNFGYRVALRGDMLVVSAVREDSSQTTVTNGSGASGDNSLNASGAVYVFRRSGSTWTQEAYLKAPNADANDMFGYSLSASGDTVAVGTRYEDSSQTSITNGASASSDNSLIDSGAVYIFRRTAGNWAQEAYIKAANADTGDTFAVDISLDSDTLVVGAWGEDSNESAITNGTTASSDNSASNSGAAYIYKRTGTAWAQEAYLKASNSEAADYYGMSVAVSGDTVVVGSDYESCGDSFVSQGAYSCADNSKTYSGAAYVYVRTGTTWAQEGFLKAWNPDKSDRFGYRVALEGDTIAVQAIYEAGPSNDSIKSGSVYVYRRTGGLWGAEAYLRAANPDAFDYFGDGLGISGNRIAAGAPFESSSFRGIISNSTAGSDNSSPESGAVYVFTR